MSYSIDIGTGSSTPTHLRTAHAGHALLSIAQRLRDAEVGQHELLPWSSHRCRRPRPKNERQVSKREKAITTTGLCSSPLNDQAGHSAMAGHYNTMPSDDAIAASNAVCRTTAMAHRKRHETASRVVERTSAKRG